MLHIAPSLLENRLQLSEYIAGLLLTASTLLGKQTRRIDRSRALHERHATERGKRPKFGRIIVPHTFRCRISLRRQLGNQFNLDRRLRNPLHKHYGWSQLTWKEFLQRLERLFRRRGRLEKHLELDDMRGSQLQLLECAPQRRHRLIDRRCRQTSFGRHTRQVRNASSRQHRRVGTIGIAIHRLAALQHYGRRGLIRYGNRIDRHTGRTIRNRSQDRRDRRPDCRIQPFTQLIPHLIHGRRFNRVHMDAHQLIQSRTGSLQHRIQIGQHLFDLFLERVTADEIASLIHREQLPRVHQRLVLDNHRLRHTSRRIEGQILHAVGGRRRWRGILSPNRTERCYPDDRQDQHPGRKRCHS